MCVLLAVAVVPGLAACGDSPAPARTVARTLPGSSPAAASSAARSAETSQDLVTHGLPQSTPVHIDIPRLGVHAPLAEMGQMDDGSIETPSFSTPNTAGWYGGSVTPGQTGTSLIVGHVDTHTGPAVFYPLSSIKQGDRIEVHRADHTTVVFGVDSVEVMPDKAFDSNKVYADATRPELRLITCGGTFDRGAQEYSSDVVVYAHLTGALNATGTKIG